MSPSIDFLNLDTILQRYTEIRIKYTSNVLDFKACPKKWPKALMFTAEQVYSGDIIILTQTQSIS